MRYLLQIILMALAVLPAAAQSADTLAKRTCADHLVSPSLSIGTLVGGQINSAGFYYKSGMGVHVSARAAVNSWLSIGVGGGIEKLQKEWMYPVYTEIVSSFSSKPNSGFFILQTGYAFSYVSAYEAFEGYKGNGGFMISPGGGYKALLHGTTQLFFAAQFRQQAFNVHYTTDAGTEYHDRFSYSLLMLKAGLSF